MNASMGVSILQRSSGLWFLACSIIDTSLEEGLKDGVWSLVIVVDDVNQK